MTVVWAEKKNRAAASEQTCLCGCRTPCKGSFAPGHDAKYKSFLKKQNIAVVGKVADMAKKHGAIR